MKRHTMSGDRRSIRAVVSWVVLLAFLATAVLPLPALAGDAVFYYHNDPTGSPVAITDAAGTKVWGADYEPFGEIAGLVETVPNNQQFLAKTVDPETSLHLLGARYYDGKIGRFLSVDPGLLHGQQASTLGRGQFHNVYAYSANNPYRFVDPSGNTPIDLLFLAVDVAKLGFAVYTGVGISSAVVDVGLSIAGVVSPVAGTGEVLKAGRAVERAAEVARGADKAVDATRGGLPRNPDDLLTQGYKEVSHPDAVKAGHREFENPTTGDKVRFDKGKPGERGYKRDDGYHRKNPDSTSRHDEYLDKYGNPVARHSKESHLSPGE